MFKETFDIFTLVSPSFQLSFLFIVHSFNCPLLESLDLPHATTDVRSFSYPLIGSLDPVHGTTDVRSFKCHVIGSLDGQGFQVKDS